MKPRNVLKFFSTFVLICCIILTCTACGTSNDKGAGVSSEAIIKEKSDSKSTPSQTEKEKYEATRQSVKDIMDAVAKFEDGGYIADGKQQDALDKVYEVAKQLKETGIATDIKRKDYSVKIVFSSGLTYFYSPKTKGTSAFGGDTNISIGTLQVYKDEFRARDSIPETAGTGDLDDAATDGIAQKLIDTYDYCTWDYNYDNKDANLRALNSFGPNQIILWHGHGYYDDEIGSALCTSETIFDVEYIDVNYRYLVDDGNYVIDAEYVKKYLPDVTNSLIYLDACSSLKDTRLAEAFHQKGAYAIIGNTDIITTIYESNMMKCTMENLVEGNTLEKSLEKAKEKYGQNDSVFYKDDGAADYAQVKIYCGGDYELYKKPQVDIGQYYMDSTIEYNKAIEDYVNGNPLIKPASFTDATSSFIQYTTEGRNLYHGTIAGVQCIDYDSLDMGFLTYLAPVDGYVLCGVKPGDSFEDAKKTLYELGFSDGWNEKSFMKKIKDNGIERFDVTLEVSDGIVKSIRLWYDNPMAG